MVPVKLTLDKFQVLRFLMLLCFSSCMSAGSGDPFGEMAFPSLNCFCSFVKSSAENRGVMPVVKSLPLACEASDLISTVVEWTGK